MLIMIAVPFIEGIAFWCVLRTPARSDILGRSSSSRTISNDGNINFSDNEDCQDICEEDRPLSGVLNKIKYIPSLFKYAIPLTWMYFLSYLINQGFVSINI